MADEKPGLTILQAHAEICELLARHTPDEFYPKHADVDAIHRGLTSVLERILPMSIDAERWQTLEEYCDWIAISPTRPPNHVGPCLAYGDSEHSFDPRNQVQRNQMRLFIDLLRKRRKVPA